MDKDEMVQHLLNQTTEAYRLISLLARASDIMLTRLSAAEGRIAGLEAERAIRKASAP